MQSTGILISKDLHKPAQNHLGPKDGGNKGESEREGEMKGEKKEGRKNEWD